MLNSVKLLTLVIILFSFSTKLKSQNFAQSFNFPQISNPAYSGINNCLEIQTANRLHKVAPGINFTKNLLDLNLFIPQINGGIQLKTIFSQSPQNIFNSYNFSFGYAYHLKINKSKKISFAIETEYKNETFNQSKLVFSGMIDVWGNVNTNNTSTIDNYTCQKLYFNSGILFKINDYFFGLSVKNIYSIYFNEQHKTPIEINVSFKKDKIINKSNIKLNLFSNIYSNISQQINIFNGIELEYFSFQTGLFSVQNIYSRQLSNGFLTYLGFTYKKININYSYEFFYGSLFLNKSSLHEFSIKYRIKCLEKNRKNTINCPAYQL